MESFDRVDDNQDIVSQIKKNFEIRDVVVGNLIFGSNIPVILVQFKNLDNLEKHWKEFNNLVTAEYLIKLQDDFSKWNSYIFFLTEEIPKPLKYEIENNKFSTRKIVIETETPIINYKVINNIISEHIVNDDIKFEVQSADVGEFPKNELISSSFNDLIKDNPKKIDDDTLIELLTKIEAGLDYEN